MTLQKSKDAGQGFGTPEALTSPRTQAQVLKHIERFVDELSDPSPIGEKLKSEERSTEASSVRAAASGILSIPPRIYQEYVDEFRELARTATNEHQRGLYL